MEWVKLVATPPYYMDAAMHRAGEAAEVLFTRGLAYCGLVESAGVIDKAMVPTLAPKSKPRADALVREGLWVDEGAVYRIRSWDKWQDEHDAAAERRRKDRDRKRLERAAVQGQSEDSPADVSTPTAESPALDVDVDVDREGQTPSVSATARPKASRRRPLTDPPDLFPITPPMREWGVEHAPLVTDPAGETSRFLDYHRAKGNQHRDWTAAWRTWMSNAQKYAARDTARPDGRRGPREAPPGTAISDEWKWTVN